MIRRQFEKKTVPLYFDIDRGHPNLEAVHSLRLKP